MTRSFSKLTSCLISLFCLTLAGCGGFPATIPICCTVPTAPAAPTVNPAVTAADIYSIDLVNQSLDVYTADLNGTASPTGSYSGSALQGGVLAVTGDASGNLYLGIYTNTLAAVQVFAPGSATASRTLTVATAATNCPQIKTLAVDSTGNLYVAISNSIAVYGPKASGTDAPIRTIAGALTTLSGSIAQIAFDATDNLFAADGKQLIEFPTGASGNVAPTLLTSSDYAPSGVAIDSTGQVYISQGTPPNASAGAYVAGVYVFPKGATTATKPTRSISGTNVGIGFYADGVFVDSAGNIFVGAVQGGQIDFLVFSATATGNVAPNSILIRSKGSTTDTQFFVR